MTETKFTKGPWERVYDAIEGSTEIRAEGGRVVGAGCQYSLDGDPIGTTHISEANAHLIAAAPDLFNACNDYAIAAFEHGNRNVGGIDPDGELLGQMRDALRKARGEAS